MSKPKISTKGIVVNYYMITTPKYYTQVFFVQKKNTEKLTK